MHDKLVCIILGLSLAACQNKQPVNETTIELSPLNYECSTLNINLDSVGYDENINLSSFFEEVSFIPLETNDHSLLGRINQFLMKGDTIFILDATLTKRVLVFDKQGRFLGQVGDVGEGPAEYREASDLGLSKDQLYVFDNRSQRILFYHLSDLKFSHAIKLGQRQNARSRYICVDDSSRIYTDVYFPGGASPYLIQEFDTNNRIINKWLSTDFYNRGYSSAVRFTGESFFHKTTVGIRFMHFASDSIMEIRDGSVYPYLAFQYYDRPSNKEIKNLSKEGNVESILDAIAQLDGVHNILHYTEGERYILFFFNEGRFTNNFIYDKKKKECHQGGFFVHDLISPDLINHSVVPRPIWEDEENVYFYIHPMEMSRFVKMIHQGEISVSNKNKAVLSQLDEEANPILICYKKGKS